MGLEDQIMERGGGLVGQLTQKFGIGADQAKSALDKIVPFIKGKLAGGLSIPGRGTSLLGSIKQNNLKAFASDPSKLGGDDAVAHGNALLTEVAGDDQEAHVQEVAKATGLDPDVVRQMMPAAAVATAGALDADGALDKILGSQKDLLAKLDQIKADTAAGKFDKK